MSTKIATSQSGAFEPIAASGARLPFVLELVFCLYLFFIGTAFIKIVPIFSTLFDGLRVEMPWLTKVLLLSYWWVLPLFSFTAIVLAILRQIVALNTPQRRATNAYLFFAAVLLPSLAILALYMPMLKLMWKANFGG